MRLAVISVQGKNYHPNRRLIEAARARGLSLELLHPFRTWCALTEEGAGLLEGRPAPTLAFPRVGSTISPYTLLLLRHLELLGCRLINRPGPVETASFKDRCLQTLDQYIHVTDDIRAFFQKHLLESLEIMVLGMLI